MQIDGDSMTLPREKHGDRGSAAIGITRWSIFAVLLLTYILVYFHRMAPGVVGEYLMVAFSTSVSMVSGSSISRLRRVSTKSSSRLA